MPLHDAARAMEGRPGKLQIVLVSQHPLARDSLCRLLELESQGSVEAVAVSSEEALQTVSHLRPDLALLDLALPTRSGIEAARALKAHAPTKMVVALLMEDEKLYQRTLQDAGIGIVMLKDGRGHELLPMLDAIWKNRADHGNQ